MIFFLESEFQKLKSKRNRSRILDLACKVIGPCSLFSVYQTVNRYAPRNNGKKSKYKLDIDSVILDQCVNGYAALVTGKTVLSIKKVTQK